MRWCAPGGGCTLSVARRLARRMRRAPCGQASARRRRRRTNALLVCRPTVSCSRTRAHGRVAVQTWHGVSPSPGADVAESRCRCGKRRARSRCRCGGRVQVSAQIWRGQAQVPAQMWQKQRWRVTRSPRRSGNRGEPHRVQQDDREDRHAELPRVDELADQLLKQRTSTGVL
jgi:hypothetical protein